MESIVSKRKTASSISSVTSSTNGSFLQTVSSEQSSLPTSQTSTISVSRSPKTPPLSATSKRKPAPIIVQTRQHSGSDRYDQMPMRKYSAGGSSFTSLSSPPVSPRALPPLKTRSPSPPLILTSVGLGAIPSSPTSTSPTSPILEPSLLPYNSQTSGNTNTIRRSPSLEHSTVRDPYRFRTPSTSARGVKNDYQTHAQSQGQGQLPSSSSSSGNGIYKQSEVPIAISHSPSEDHVVLLPTTQPSYQPSPVLSENNPNLTRVQQQQPGLTPSGVIGAPGGTPGGNSRPSSPLHNGYQPVQQQFYSPYQSNQHLPTQDRQDYRTDPYRSAYSQQQQYHQMQYQGSPYQDSTLSMGYPMRTLPSHESNIALATSFNHQSHSHSGTTPASSESGGTRSDRYQDMEDGRQSSAMRHQYSMTDSSTGADHPIRKGEEDDENSDILQSISGSKNGHKKSNKKKNRSSPGDESEEEGQERGALRQRDGKRCWCCSRRLCVYMSFVIIICLGVVLYFVIPRSPGYSFVSVAPIGDPIVTRDRIQELFSLQMRVDSSDNYLPIRFTKLEMNMWLKIDQTKIGNNDDLPSTFVIKPKNMNQIISVQMMIDYTSLKIDTNADGTLQTLITACKPVDTSSSAVPPGINLTFGGKMYIWGLSWIWKPQFSFNVESVPCPINAREPDSSSSPSGGNGGSVSSTSSNQPTTTSAAPATSQSNSASRTASATSSAPAATRTA